MPDLLPLLDRLGERAQRRTTPRFGVAVAAAGSVLVVLGMLVLSGYELGVEEDFAGGDGGQRVPGIVLSVAVMVAGYVLLANARHGPLGAAGVAASALATPALVFFLTFDENSAGPPVSVDAILLVSTAVWAASYLVGPGRSHAFYLAAALVGLWYFVVEQVEPVLSESTFLGFAFDFDGGAEDRLTTIGLVSLVFGVGYLLGGWAADRQGLVGLATPFVGVGDLALVSGLFALAPDLEEVGTGVLFTVFGAVLAAFGARTSRRFTTWLGAIGVFSGVTLILGDAIGDEPRPFGVCLMLVGVATIVLANAVVRATGEPAETEPSPSFVGRPVLVRSSRAEHG